MKRALPIALVLASLTVLGGATYSSLGQTAEKRLPEVDFTAKVLMIYCKEEDKNAMLSDVRVRRLGDKSFLAGKVLPWNEARSAWDKATQWVAIDEIVTIFEFGSVKEALEAAKEAEQASAPMPVITEENR